MKKFSKKQRRQSNDELAVTKDLRLKVKKSLGILWVREMPISLKWQLWVVRPLRSLSDLKAALSSFKSEHGVLPEIMFCERKELWMRHQKMGTIAYPPKRFSK